MRIRSINYAAVFALVLALFPSFAFAQEKTKHSNTFYAGYSNINLSNLKDKTSSRYDYPYNGFLIGWRYNIKPNTDMDLYVHVGAEFGWNFNHDFYDKETLNATIALNFVSKSRETQDIVPLNCTANVYNYKRNMNWCGFKIPLNIAYRFHVKDTKLYFDPFIGIHIGTIVYGYSTEDYDYDLTCENYEEINKELMKLGIQHEHEGKSILSNTNEDYDNTSLKRIYAGWQVGVNVGYDKYTLGFSFENEMLHMSNYFKSRTLSVNFGYTL